MEVSRRWWAILGAWGQKYSFSPLFCTPNPRLLALLSQATDPIGQPDANEA